MVIHKIAVSVLMMLFLESQHSFAQSDQYLLKTDIVTDICKTEIANSIKWTKSPFIFLKTSFNYAPISVNIEPVIHRYEYGSLKYDTALKTQLKSQFRLVDQFNFVNDSINDYEFLHNSFYTTDIGLAENSNDGYLYLNIGQPIESWDEIYLHKDSIYYKYYKKINFSDTIKINIPVIKYIKRIHDAIGISYKQMYQYLVLFRDRRYAIVGKKIIKLD